MQSRLPDRRTPYMTLTRDTKAQRGKDLQGSSNYSNYDGQEEEELEEASRPEKGIGGAWSGSRSSGTYEADLKTP
jgi:hypothetical protein